MRCLVWPKFWPNDWPSVREACLWIGRTISWLNIAQGVVDIRAVNNSKLPLVILIACVAIGIFFVRQHQNNTYSSQVEANFMAGCNKGAAAGATGATICGCIYSKIKSTVPFDQFKTAEEQMKVNPADVPPWLQPIALDCAKTAAPRSMAPAAG